MWEHRKILGGVAHVHPGYGEPTPSHEDVSTWAAVERGLGRRLLWPIITMDRELHYVGAGWLNRYAHSLTPFLHIEDIEELRRRAQQPTRRIK